MKHILVTGADGFLGRNLVAKLSMLNGVTVTATDIQTPFEDLRSALKHCDLIFHLAGCNRPANPSEFRTTNRDFTFSLCDALREMNRSPKIVFSSSIQAELDNPYGVSKRQAERALIQFGSDSGAVIRIFRLNNLYGKWSRPNYNSVVATFCHNIGNDLPIQISDPARTIELSYVDDVVDAFLAEIPRTESATAITSSTASAIPAHCITLGELALSIRAFREMRDTLVVPNLSSTFQRRLYATYLSYVPQLVMETRLLVRNDNRGSLAEFMKSESGGQIFLSRTLPGVVRGNHYHHTKTEKFFVVEGEGLLRMRHIGSEKVMEFHLRGRDYQVVDIPPGYTHSIENVGTGEMVTLFWSSEIFDPEKPDTYFLPVGVKTDSHFMETK